MTNAVYPKYKEAMMDALANSDLHDGVVKCGLLDTGAYAYSAAHQFLSDVAGGAVIVPAIALTTKTVTNGLFDADNVTFLAVSGPTIEALLLYIDTGVANTSRLVVYMDSGITGLPATPNGGNITVTWNSSGIFQL